MPIPADQIDPDARKVLRRLVSSDYQAYLVGGCVRDLLLARTPKDFDIATSATPNEVKSLFRNCRIIGRRFRLAHIFFGPKIIETATFRANPREVADEADEGMGGSGHGGPGGEDGFEAAPSRDDGDILIRHDNVFGTAEEDARRRDFTINGLFYDIESDEVIDYVGGLQDLIARTIRTIGDPEIRFREDPVRILRAIKFAARLDFEIDPETYRAIEKHLVDIPKCAPPRVLEEIYRLLRGGAAVRSIEILRDTGVLDLLLPEIADMLRRRPGSVEAQWFFRILDQIDRTVTKERPPSNAVLLCVLLAPLLGETVFEEPAPGTKVRDLGGYLDERARPMLERMRVTRRDIERTRQILLVQRRIAPSKRRKGKGAALVRRDWFDEALQVCELVAMTLRPLPGGEAELVEWRRVQKGDAIEPSEAAQPGGPGEAADTSEGPQRRRRRRRRRGGAGSAGNQLQTEVTWDVLDPEHNRELIESDIEDARDEGAPPLPHAATQHPAPAPARDALAAVAADEPGAQVSEAPPSTGMITPER